MKAGCGLQALNKPSRSRMAFRPSIRESQVQVGASAVLPMRTLAGVWLLQARG